MAIGVATNELEISRRACVRLGTASVVAYARASARADTTSTVLKLYSDGGPASPYGTGARVLADKLADLTADRVRVETILGIGPAGQALGPQRAQGRGLIEAVRSGDADMAIVSAAALGDLVPDLLAIDLPFLFADSHQARAALDGAAGQILLSKLPTQGLVGLAWGETGMLQLTTRSRPIRVPADLSGLAIRVQENPVQRDTWTELGARAVSIPALPDTVAALRDGRLDGMATTMWVLSFLKIETIQHCLSLTAHGYQPNIFLASTSALGRLDKAQRDALLAAAQAGAVANREAVDRADAAALIALRSAGVEIEEKPDRAAFRAALEPLYLRWRARVSPELLEQLGL